MAEIQRRVISLQQPRTRPDFVATPTFGRDLANLAGQVGDIAYREAKEQQDRNDRTALMEAELKAQEAAIGALERAQADAGPGGDGLTDAATEAWEIASQTIRDEAPSLSDDGQARMNLLLGKVGLRLGVDARAAQKEASFKYIGQTLDKSSDVAEKVALQNPDNWKAVYDNHMARIDDLSKDLPHEVRAARKTADGQAIAIARFNGLMEQNRFADGRAALAEGGEIYEFLTGEQLTEATSALDRKEAAWLREQEKKNKDNDMLGTIDAAFRLGVPLDFRDDKTKKAADKYFQQHIAPRIEGLPMSDRKNAILEYSTRIGILPKTVQGAIRASVASGDPEHVAEMADLVARIDEVSPHLLDQMASKDLRVLDMVRDFIAGGTNIDEAVEFSRDAIFKENEPRRKERRAEVQEADFKKKNASWLDNQYDTGLFDFGRDITPGVQADFDRAVEANYLAGMTAEAARTNAFRDINRVWGITDVGMRPDGVESKRTMRYAPERVYQDKEGWIQEQFKEQMRAFGYDPKRVMIQSDKFTARDSEGNPTYGLVYVDENGVHHDVEDKEGHPMRFRPNYKTSPAFERAERKRAKTEERAKRRREKFNNQGLMDQLMILNMDQYGAPPSSDQVY